MAGTKTVEPSLTEIVELSFECPQPTGVSWVVDQVSFIERMNEPYSLRIWLRTESRATDLLQLLGQSCKLDVTRGTFHRPVPGIVSQVAEGDTNDQWAVAAIEVVPALHALRYRVDTRIFQDSTVLKILEKVLGEGLSPYDRKVKNLCSRTYPTCEYRVQYNESDFTFCERLMEEEGIAYWFELDGETETLVLSDSASDYEDISSIHGGVLEFSSYQETVAGHEYVTDFHLESKLRSTKVSMRYFDWTHPSTPHTGASSKNDFGADGREPNGAIFGPDREVYQHDFRPITFHEYSDGSGFQANDLQDQARLRRQEQGGGSREGHGHSTVSAIKVASVFELQGHEDSDLDGRYLTLEVHHVFGGAGGRSYNNYFRCIPEAVVYRPKRETPRPRIASIQTATVVGPAGEEIHTDSQGRIKVQFHWDRLGAYDERSSCWIRVMQPWAGPGWGFLFIPRIGMEVIVNFVNGDIDQPMVIGSVYNGDNPPPYTLPDEKTKSTIKSNSSLGGGGFNEFRFEDKAGSEEIYTHAQKDYNEVVEHDHNTLVHNDQTNTVDRNQFEVVHLDQSMTVNRHRTKTVVGNETSTVVGNETTAVQGTRTETVVGDEAVTLQSSRTTSISSNDVLTVSGSRVVTVLAGFAQSVLGACNSAVGGIKAEEVGIDYVVTAGNSIKLKAGKSTITLESDGTITIDGVKIEINGERLIDLTSAKIDQNC